MYMTLSRKNIHSAIVDDNGWPCVEALGQCWERIDIGVWENNNTGELATRQKNGSWKVNGLRYDCIKSLMLDETARLRAA